MTYTPRTHYFMLSLIIIGVLYPFYFDYWGRYFLQRLFAQGVLVFVTVSMTLLYCRYGRAVDDLRWPYKMPGVPLIATLLVIYMLLSAAIAYFVLQNFPNSADEYDYWFQAMTFASGRIWNDAPVLPEFFTVPWMIIKDGKWLTQYDPGWPSVLALSITLRIPPWLVGPIVGMLSLVAFFVFCRRVEDYGTALFAVAVCAATPFFIFNTASYFNHTLAGLFAILFVYFIVKNLQSDAYYHAVLAGVFLGALGVTRLYSALLFVLPVLPILCRGEMRPLMVRGFWLCLGGAPFLAGLLVYNYLVTGNPLVLVKTWGYQDLKLYPMTSLLVSGGLEKSFWNTFNYIFEISEYIWPLFSAMYLGALVYKIKEKTIRFYDWYPLIFVIGYFVFADNAGNRYGPRYYFEAFPFATLTVCSAARNLFRSSGHGFARVVAVHIFASQIIIGLVNIPFLAWLQHRIVSERMDLFNKVESAGLSNAMVFVVNSTGYIRQMWPRDLIRNGLDLSGEVIYAQDREDQRECLIRHFPDREIWRYTRETSTPEGVLEKVDRPDDDLAVGEQKEC